MCIILCSILKLSVWLRVCVYNTADVVSRPDCYWGRQCRTQKCKQAHARYWPTFHIL